MSLDCSVIGCGRMGTRRANAIDEHPGAELVWVADAAREHAKAAAEEFDCPFYTDIQSVVKRDDVDAVFVSTPNQFHAEISIPVLEDGTHVFCEKPLARTPTEAEEMVQAAGENGATLKVSSNLRYFPSVRKARELLDEGAIGEPYFIKSTIGNGGWQLDNWFSNPEKIGGGTLLDNGAHLLDIYRWFMGEVVECQGYTTTSHHDVDPLEDNAFAQFRFENGRIGTLHSSWTEWDDYMYSEIYGSDGYIRINNRMPDAEVIHGDKDGGQTIYDFSKLSPTSYDDEMDAYVTALLEGEQPEPTGLDGMRAVEMAHGIYESTETGKRIDLWDSEKREIFEELLDADATELPGETV